MTFLNLIISNGKVLDNDRTLLFPDNEMVFVSREDRKLDIFDCLVWLGAFKSKSQARKNWKGPTSIPDGWFECFVGKRKRHLCIWNPSE